MTCIGASEAAAISSKFAADAFDMQGKGTVSQHVSTMFLGRHDMSWQRLESSVWAEELALTLDRVSNTSILNYIIYERWTRHEAWNAMELPQSQEPSTVSSDSESCRYHLHLWRCSGSWCRWCWCLQAVELCKHRWGILTVDKQINGQSTNWWGLSCNKSLVLTAALMLFAVVRHGLPDNCHESSLEICVNYRTSLVLQCFAYVCHLMLTRCKKYSWVWHLCKMTIVPGTTDTWRSPQIALWKLGTFPLSCSAVSLTFRFLQCHIQAPCFSARPQRCRHSIRWLHHGLLDPAMKAIGIILHRVIGKVNYAVGLNW